MNSGGDTVDISDNLIMPREQVKESSWMPPSAAQIAWDENELEVEFDEDGRKVWKR